MESQHQDEFLSADEGSDSEKDGSEDGNLDDLEYLTLDLVNVLPTESWQRLLKLLNSREGRAIELAQRNEDLRKEVRHLRGEVRRQLSNSSLARSTSNLSLSESEAHVDPATTALLQDLECRVAGLAMQRRGESACIDTLSDDVRDAAKETLVFLNDTEAVACNLPRLLAMLTQWLSWAMNPEVAPRGAAALLAQVPEKALQHALVRATAVLEAHSGGREPHEFSELPHCVPLALQAIKGLPQSDHAQRVGLACVALGAFATIGRQSLLEDMGSGLKALLWAAGRRPLHPELQTWALVAISNCAYDLPKDNEGASLAWDSALCCAASLRRFRNAPDVLQHAAHALARLLHVHPKRVSAAARTKNLHSVLQEAAQRFPKAEGKWDMLHRSIAEALAALERAWAIQPGGYDGFELSCCSR